MKNAIDASRLTRSWLLAWNMRCCPPDTVLAGDPGPELERHLRVCPLCRRDREDGLPQVRLDLSRQAVAEKSSPRPGELWSLAGSLAGWGPKCRYYSPPVVLVTGLADDKTVNVVQIFGDISLAGPDDILLDNDITGFAEPWNRYTMQNRDLEFLLGSVSAECVLRLARAMDRQPSSLPPGSLLWFFRQMEVETGWYFARQSIGGLLGPARQENGLVSREILLADLQKLPLILPKISPDDLPETILARTMPADDLLPMAAAAEEPGTIRILVFSAGQGRIQDVRMIAGHLNPPRLELPPAFAGDNESFLYIGGSCGQCFGSNSEWLFRWQCGEEVLEPLPGQFGAEDGVFWAVFSTDELSDPLQGELLVRIIEYRE